MLKDSAQFSLPVNPITILFILLFATGTLGQSCKRYENGRCVQCNDAYTMKNGYCTSCGSNCLVCVAASWAMTGIQCLKCAPGYTIDKWSTCSSCSKNCLTCTSVNYGYPDCKSCEDGYQLYESNGKGACKKIIVLWPFFLGFGTLLVILFSTVIYCLLKSSKQDKRNNIFKLKIINQAPLYIQTPSTLLFTLTQIQSIPESELAQAQAQDHEYQLVIQIHEKVTASVKFTSVTEQRVGNSVYRTYREGIQHLQKTRKIAEKKVLVKNQDLVDGKYNGQIDFVSQLNHGFSAQHYLEICGLLKVKARRVDWPVGQFGQFTDNFNCYFDNSKYRFCSDVLNVEMRQGSAQATLKMTEFPFTVFGKTNYGTLTLQLHNKTDNPLKYSFCLQKTYTSKFNWYSVSKFKKYNKKQRVYIGPQKQTSMKQMQISKSLIEAVRKKKELTFDISECRVYNQIGFFTSTPLVLKIWVRRTGLFFWLFSGIVSRKYEVPIMIEPNV